MNEDYIKNNDFGLGSIDKPFSKLVRKKDGSYGMQGLDYDQQNTTAIEDNSINTNSSAFDNEKIKDDTGLFDMNDRGFTKFGSYANTASSIADIGLGIIGADLENKKVKIAQENADINKLAKLREFQQQDAAIARQQQLQQNMIGTPGTKVLENK